MNKLASFHRLLSIVLLLLSGLPGLRAQTTILSQPPPNDFRFEDLWNLSLSKDASVSYNSYYITLRIFDTHRGLLLEAKTKNFTLTGSTLTVTSGTLSQLTPFEYPFSGSSVTHDIARRGGLFPAGDYRFDYTFYGNGTVRLADYSLTHSVLMPSFLQQVAVFDKDTLQEENPTFMWLPASATQTGGSFEKQEEYKLTYVLSVAEVLTNQTPYTAITSNPKFFHREGLDNTLLTYPFSARRFEPCKTYAWQVRGVINGQTVISSEIWTFHTPCEKEEPVPTVPVLVKQSPDLAVCHVINNTVYFAYFEEYQVGEAALLNATITNSKGTIVAEAGQLNLPVKKGYNTFTLNACPKGADLPPGDTYTLVITNAKNEKWYLRIINNQKTNNCY